MIQVISSTGVQYNTGRIYILDKYGKLKSPGGGGGGTVTSVATTGPITGGTITTSGTIGITQATSTTDGYLSSIDWNDFNNKYDAPTGTTAQYIRGDGSLATFPATSSVGFEQNFLLMGA